MPTDLTGLYGVLKYCTSLRLEVLLVDSSAVHYCTLLHCIRILYGASALTVYHDTDLLRVLFLLLFRVRVLFDLLFKKLSFFSLSRALTTYTSKFRKYSSSALQAIRRWRSLLDSSVAKRMVLDSRTVVYTVLLFPFSCWSILVVFLLSFCSLF